MMRQFIDKAELELFKLYVNARRTKEDSVAKLDEFFNGDEVGMEAIQTVLLIVVAAAVCILLYNFAKGFMSNNLDDIADSLGGITSKDGGAAAGGVD